MHSRKVTLTAAALFAIGVAFAAQPTTDRGDRNGEDVQRRTPWVPGRNMLMSAHESRAAPLAPPR
jgi:hypothetical protein